MGKHLAKNGSFAWPCGFLSSSTALKERCPQRLQSRVERVKAKVEPMLTEVAVDSPSAGAPRGQSIYFISTFIYIYIYIYMYIYI